MPQGKQPKKTIIKPKTKAAKQSAPLRKGRIVKASKKKGQMKQDKLQRKLVAGMTASLEQAMSVKAGAVGKLSIMKEAENKGKANEKNKKWRKF